MTSCSRSRERDIFKDRSRAFTYHRFISREAIVTGKLRCSCFYIIIFWRYCDGYHFLFVKQKRIEFTKRWNIYFYFSYIFFNFRSILDLHYKKDYNINIKLKRLRREEEITRFKRDTNKLCSARDERCPSRFAVNFASANFQPEIEITDLSISSCMLS